MCDKLLHICEVCCKEEFLSSEEAYEQGWDYPPLMGQFNVISPRICPECSIKETLWWALVIDKKSLRELSNKQKETILRIHGEPRNIEYKYTIY